MQIIPEPEGIKEAVFSIPLLSKFQNLRKMRLFLASIPVTTSHHEQLFLVQEGVWTGNQTSASEAVTPPDLQGEALQLGSQLFLSLLL